MIKFSPQELRKRVDEVLFYIWDPIGVSPDPNARNEYSAYVDKIETLLNQQDAAFQIKKYLCEIESGMMGLSPANEEGATEVAKLLIAHKEAIDGGRA